MMLSLTLISLAGATPVSVKGPEPIRPETWVRYTDYPTTVLRAGQVGTVWFEVMIDSAGKPYGCKVIVSSNVKALDDVSCRLMMARGRFEPARDQFGAAISSSFRRAANWSVNWRSARSEWPVDLSVKLNRLPDGVQPEVTVAVVEGADGSFEACSVAKGSGSEKLDQTACDAMKNARMVDPMIGPAGSPVRAVRLRRVSFQATMGS
jgi:protein TonB